MNKPSKKGIKRDSKGRYVKGTGGGPGKPSGLHVRSLRSALLQEVNEGDVRAVARKLIDLAKGGDIAAAKLLFDRLFGTPLPLDILERVEALEKSG